MPRVPILTSAAFLARHGELERGPDPDEPDWAEVVEASVNADEASLAGSYWSHGYAGFLETGDVSRLEHYGGARIAGYPLVTDPDLIEGFYDEHGHMDFQEYYKP